MSELKKVATLRGRAGAVRCPRCLELERNAPSAEDICREIKRVREERERYFTREQLLKWAEDNEAESARLRAVANSRGSSSSRLPHDSAS